MNKQFIEDLIAIIKENPDIEIKCSVDSDIVADDGHSWWLGEINTNSTPKIREYSTDIEECIVFKADDDYQDWFENLFDVDNFLHVSDDDWDKFIKEKVDEIANWKTAIFISVTTEI